MYHAYSFAGSNPRETLTRAARLFFERYGCKPVGIFVNQDELAQFDGLGLQPLPQMPRKAFYFEIKGGKANELEA